MKIRKVNNKTSIRALLDHLNVCHDGSIRRISFLKDRELDKDGNLVYPFAAVENGVKCKIEVELLLNSYVGASPKQIVVFNFEEVRSFRFFQKNTFDYSDILEVNFSCGGTDTFEFSFYATSKKIRVLTLVCSKVVCRE